MVECQFGEITHAKKTLLHFNSQIIIIIIFDSAGCFHEFLYFLLFHMITDGALTFDADDVKMNNA